jgi:hypothetical protein
MSLDSIGTAGISCKEWIIKSGLFEKSLKSWIPQNKTDKTKKNTAGLHNSQLKKS